MNQSIKALGNLRNEIQEQLKKDSLKIRKELAKDYLLLIERRVAALGLPESPIKRVYLKTLQQDVERLLLPDIYERKLRHEAKSKLEPLSEENTPTKRKAIKKSPVSPIRFSPTKLSTAH